MKYKAYRYFVAMGDLRIYGGNVKADAEQLYRVASSLMRQNKTTGEVTYRLGANQRKAGLYNCDTYINGELQEKKS